MDVEQLREKAKGIKYSLGLESYSVGVKIIYIEYLSIKAVGNSRKKGAYAQLMKKEAEFIAR